MKKLKYGVGGSAVAVILAAVFAMEGDYSNHPSDPGGETMYGITVDVARAHGYKGEMKNLPRELAVSIYEKDYVTKPGFREIIDMSPAVGHKLVDAGVNAGTPRSSRWLQSSLNSLNRGGKDYATLAVDSKVGAGTANAYKQLQAKRGKIKACELVIKLIDAQQATHYMSLTKLSDFTVGWIDHRIGNVPLESCTQ